MALVTLTYEANVMPTTSTELPKNAYNYHIDNEKISTTILMMIGIIIRIMMVVKNSKYDEFRKHSSSENCTCTKIPLLALKRV